MPNVRRGAARWDFWDWWIDRKTRWVRDEVHQLDAGGLPDDLGRHGAPADLPEVDLRLPQREGRRRPLPRNVEGGRAPVRADLHPPRQPDDGVSRAGPLPPRGAARHRQGARRGRARADHRLPHHELGNGGDLVAHPRAHEGGRRRPRREHLRLHGQPPPEHVEVRRRSDLRSTWGASPPSRRLLEKHPNVSAVLLESPENPTLRLADIEAISRLTEARGVVLIVDNTFCSPYLQQPFRLGADFVVHSLTKFINGHSTSVAGAILGPFRFMKHGLFAWYKDLGATPSPFDSWLNAMSVQSLAVRQEAESASAARIAAFLRHHPKVASVDVPRLPRLPAGRHREEADADRRLAHQLRGEGGGGGRRAADELLRPERHADGAGRQPRRDDQLHPAPVLDDARRRPGGRPPRARHHAGPDPDVGRPRGARHPDRPPRPGPEPPE